MSIFTISRLPQEICRYNINRQSIAINYRVVIFLRKIDCFLNYAIEAISNFTTSLLKWGNCRCNIYRQNIDSKLVNLTHTISLRKFRWFSQFTSKWPTIFDFRKTMSMRVVFYVKFHYELLSRAKLYSIYFSIKYR